MPQLPQQLIQSALGAADLVVSFSSTVTPPVEMNISGYAQAPPSPPNPLAEILMRFLAPTVEIKSRLGNQVYSPYGRPTANLAPVAGVILVVGFGLAAFGAFELLRKLRR
jgi:hypothetical protein